MEHLLITGGCGYVGTALCKELLNKNYILTVIDAMWFGNYLCPHENLNIVQTNILDTHTYSLDGVDRVIHLANIANDPTGELNSKNTWEINVLASKLLIEKAIKAKVKHFIYASSGSVYGIKKEEQVTEDLDLVPISDYNKTKMISERVLLSYQDQIKVTSIRPATVCGHSPRMRFDVSVNLLTIQALKNNQITVFGGEQTRPNIHIKDMVRTYLHAIENDDTVTGIFNAGFENLKIKEIANIVQRYIETEIVVTESNDPRSYRLNSDRLLKTGFQPIYTVEDAIKEIKDLYHKGIIDDDEKYYNLKMMLKQKIGV